MAFKPNIDEIRDTRMRAAQIRPTAICSLSGEKRTSSLSTPQNESDHQGKSYDGLHLDSELDRLSEYLEISKNELEARQELRFLHSIINLMPVGLTVRSQHGKCLLANESAAYLSIAPKLASEAPSPASENPAKNGDAINPWANIIRSGLTTTTEERVGEGHNERIFLTCHKPVRIDNEPLLLSASVDYTDRKRQEDELSQRAYLDELTGLPNRVLIEDHVERLISSGDQSCGRFALAFIDLDNFKHINDYYTHAIGDALLKKVAQRITSHVRSSDVLGRISGDEFLLVIHPLQHDEEELSATIDRLMKDLKEPFFIEQFEIFTSASMGLSIYPDHGHTYEILRRNADTAMYRVKAEAKGGVALFNADMGCSITARMAQEQRLRLAVRDNRFSCAFQPKVDLRTQEVVGLEALIRLRDDDGVIQACDFIGLTAELGLIDDLAHLTLAEIVKSMELIDQEFGKDVTISINIAAKQAGDAHFMRTFCDELLATNRARRFMIEVTEDAFIAENAFQSEVMPMLRNFGIKVSIDDFGVGYSSLATLAGITADEIKVDRSFITNIHNRPRNQSVLKAVEALSNALEMTVIAEGIETYEELAFLQAATRIRYGQGYYFARPFLIDELGPKKRSAIRTSMTGRHYYESAKESRSR
jgi:c-di-GMP phosphodiesterase Gmr